MNDMFSYNLLLLFFTGYLVAVFLWPGLHNFLSQAGLTAVNYHGEAIPRGGGLIFSSCLLVGSLCVQLFGQGLDSRLLFLLLGVVGTAFLGAIDDWAGDKTVQGLKGHLGQLLRGTVTTGGLKAVGGSLLALFVALPFSQGPGEVLVNSLLMALAVNLTNLLDLRPGRAVKGALLGIFLVACTGNLAEISWISLAVGIILAYFPHDLKARVMLGDSGSNSLGMVLGLSMVWGLPLPGKMASLVFLVLVHLVAEFYSLTKLIEKWSLLQLLDRLGR